MSEKAATEVIVMFHVQAKKGKESELRAALTSVVTKSRHEPGCISYELHELEDDPSKFVTYERWISRDALALHFTQGYIANIQARAGDLVESSLADATRFLTRLRPEA